MPHNISRRKLIQKLHQFGFNGPHPGGRHLYMVRSGLKVRIPNPHQSDITKPLVVKILNQADISHDEWDNLK